MAEVKVCCFQWGAVLVVLVLLVCAVGECGRHALLIIGNIYTLL